MTDEIAGKSEKKEHNVLATPRCAAHPGPSPCWTARCCLQNGFGTARSRTTALIFSKITVAAPKKGEFFPFLLERKKYLLKNSENCTPASAARLLLNTEDQGQFTGRRVCVTSQKLPRFQAPEPLRPLQHSMSAKRLTDSLLRIYCAILNRQNAYLRDWPSNRLKY